MGALYNDIEGYAVNLLKLRIEDGWLPKGEVSREDIRTLCKKDLSVYGQLHLFAGIGGFPLACRIAGLPDDFPIFTGGFPCQPFSVAGNKKGALDNRYLWPETLAAIKRHRPAIAILENVAGLVSMDFPIKASLMDYQTLAGGLRDYLYHAKAPAVAYTIAEELQAEGYSVVPILVPACGLNAKHERKRIWFIAISNTYADRVRSTKQKCEHERTENGWRGCSDGLDARETMANSEICYDRGEPRSNESESREERIQKQDENRIFGKSNKTRPSTKNVADTSGRGRGGNRNSIKEKGQYGVEKSQPVSLRPTGSKESDVPNSNCERRRGGNPKRENAKNAWQRPESKRDNRRGMGPGELKSRMGRKAYGLSFELDPTRAFADDWECGIPRIIKDLEYRIPRIKGLGNAIVPQIAAEIISLLMKAYGIEPVYYA